MCCSVFNVMFQLDGEVSAEHPGVPVPPIGAEVVFSDRRHSGIGRVKDYSYDYINRRVTVICEAVSVSEV